MKRINIHEAKSLFPYLQQEKEFNIFIIGDIENATDDAKYIDIYIDGNIKKPDGILLRYYDYFIIYSPDGMNYRKAAEIIGDYGNAQVLSGKESCMDKIKPFLENLVEKERRMYFSALKNPNFTSSDFKIHKLTPEDTNKVLGLLNNIEEFDSRNDESFISGIRNGSKRSYYLETDGKVISTASTSAESKDAAMIVAVATDKRYRNKGYATAVMSKLCADLLKEGKTPCLFYNNPSAGKIYERMGFRRIGFWKMLKFKS
ncbi:MAG: GNAT family N-acetyltransferase [Kosmotoga sp.]|nr:MAG: GNAT family N-acetyltransferase [Kosmotoga sp.]